MQVVYADKELARCAGDKAYAVRKMGQRRAEVYLDRINDLQGAADLESLKMFQDDITSWQAIAPDNGRAI